MSCMTKILLKNIILRNYYYALSFTTDNSQNSNRNTCDTKYWIHKIPNILQQVIDIPLTEKNRVKDDHLSTCLRFFSLPLGI